MSLREQKRKGHAHVSGLLLLIVGAALAGCVSARPARAPDVQESTPAINGSAAGSAASDRSPQNADSSDQDVFVGAVLGGAQSLVLDFNQADYDKALASKKVVLLYFYANWCPICAAEFPKLQAAFNDLEVGSVIAFRVNFNDSDTDAAEQALARQFGVAYQHTKVILRDGVRVLKSPESWEQSRYLEEVNKLLK